MSREGHQRNIDLANWTLEQCLNAIGLKEDDRRKFSPSMGDIIQALGVSAVVNGLSRIFDEQKSLVQGSFWCTNGLSTTYRKVIALKSCCVLNESPFSCCCSRCRGQSSS